MKRSWTRLGRCLHCPASKGIHTLVIDDGKYTLTCAQTGKQDVLSGDLTSIVKQWKDIDGEK